MHGYPVAGFAFSTDGPVAVEGYYYGKQLECLGVYTPEAAVERFKSCIESPDDATTDDDPFERALDEFIASETKTLETEHYAFDDEADEEDNATAGEDEPDTPDEATDSEPDEAGQQLCCLDHLVGLTAVKEKLGIYEKIVKFNKLQRRQCPHSVIAAAPCHVPRVARHRQDYRCKNDGSDAQKSRCAIPGACRGQGTRQSTRSVLQ